ncbi:hypothetical protein [Psychromonas sp. 14N.309.X.WAT.B.A12]|uniref:hypothetical protein n=1 Tax=unclassified Psychromonas TaxID=2614957 RepID=UPI0025B1D6C6|nr:hypothetical protein [Psychromonas sp. 14N.309.X.WAT.B.A12]MDN2664404.1 hypothetical protein [Psychromonas sp. 14N.309.X.WAT.B.A12]
MINFLSLQHSRFLLVPMVLTLAACTSKPREVYATIPLVTASDVKPNKQALPPTFVSALNNPASTALTYKQYSITIAPTYVSALSYSCRQMIFNESNQASKTRIACEIPYKENDKLMKSWFLEHAITEADNNIDL